MRLFTDSTPPLQLEADVLVIGGGLAGTWAAIAALIRTLFSTLLAGSLLLASTAHAAELEPLRVANQKSSIKLLLAAAGQLQDVHLASAKGTEFDRIPITDAVISNLQQTSDIYLEEGVLIRRVDVSPGFDASFNVARAEADTDSVATPP
ncbi:hypothetical protein [Pseudomonas sp. R5(2019)]|uniref:hypothetical protein n=1 Tax=Pseudomonas sp. R5(2019) TaxID=2697566 RepID=UPI001412FBEE|nr:hypothetical protein [Pseudomonas sp. R5(2019)]NBA94905.1 hypothetical protein [Pseudomonas sp. R5(2019)]